MVSRWNFRHLFDHWPKIYRCSQYWDWDMIFEKSVDFEIWNLKFRTLFFKKSYLSEKYWLQFFYWQRAAQLYGPPYIYGVPHGILQVFINLLDENVFLNLRFFPEQSTLAAAPSPAPPDRNNGKIVKTKILQQLAIHKKNVKMWKGLLRKWRWKKSESS
jgi:hypothetical protein